MRDYKRDDARRFDDILHFRELKSEDGRERAEREEESLAQMQYYWQQQ